MTPDANLILLRHAEPELTGRCHGTVSDPGLSARGAQNAATLGLKMRVLGRELGGVTRLLTSPAARAIETTAQLAVTLELTPSVDERWRERHFGEWEGGLWSELWPTAPEEVREDPDAYASWTPPGGETPQEVAERVDPALADALVGTGTTLVVTHAGSMRQAIATALGIPNVTTMRVTVPYARAVVLSRTQDVVTLDRLGV